MRQPILVTVGIVWVLGLVGPAAAEDAPAVQCPICRTANDQAAPYAGKATSTLMRGAVNVLFGWTELLIQPTEEVDQGGNLAIGIGKGVGYAMKRTAAGLGEVLTFWTPRGKERSVTLATDCPICMGKRPPPSRPSRDPG